MSCVQQMRCNWRPPSSGAKTIPKTTFSWLLTNDCKKPHCCTDLTHGGYETIDSLTIASASIQLS